MLKVRLTADNTIIFVDKKTIRKYEWERKKIK